MKTIKIFIGSSDEFKKERLEADGVINELNKKFNDIKIELLKWEVDVPPGFNEKGVQKSINPLLAEADIVIILIKQRFGYGTEEEFKISHRYWETYDSPKILVYFDTAPINIPQKIKEVADLERVIRFKESIAEKGLYKEFNSNDESLLQLIKGHLEIHINALKDSEKITKPSFETNKKPKIATILHGRQQSLNILNNVLKSLYHKIIYVHGINGIGKTALIDKLVESVNLNTDLQLFNHIVRVNVNESGIKHEIFEDNFFSKICEDLNITISVTEKLTNKLKSIISILTTYKQDVLIVVDNFENVASIPQQELLFFEALISLPKNYKFIFISCKTFNRSIIKSNEIFEYIVPALSKEDTTSLIEEKGLDIRTIKPEVIQTIHNKSNGIPMLIEYFSAIQKMLPEYDFEKNLEAEDLPTSFIESATLFIDQMDSATRFAWDVIYIATKFGYNLNKKLIYSLIGNDHSIIARMEQYPLISINGEYVSIVSPLEILSKKFKPIISEDLILDKISTYYSGLVASTLKQEIESYNKSEEFKIMLSEKENLIKTFDYFLQKSTEGDKDLSFYYRILLYQYATDISWFLWINGFLQERITYLEKTSELSIKYEEEPYKCIAIINDVAWTYFHRGDLGSAEKTIKFFENHFLEVAAKSNIRYQAMINRLIANLYIRKSENSDKIIPLLESCKDIFEKIGEKRRIAAINSEIGTYYFSKKEFDIALKYFKEALTICNAINEIHSRSVYNLQAGKALFYRFSALNGNGSEKKTPLDDLYEAEEYLKSGLQDAKMINRRQIEGGIYLMLARVYLIIEPTNTEIIRGYAENARMIFEQINDKSGHSESVKLIDSIS